MQYKYLIVGILILVVVAICFRNYLPDLSLFNNKAKSVADDLEKELTECEEAIKKNPNDAKGYYNKGLVLKKLAEYELAIEAYDKAIALNPSYSNAYSNKALVLKELRKYELALEAYDIAIELNPKDFSTYFDKGIVLSILDKHKLAVESYSKAIELNSRVFPIKCVNFFKGLYSIFKFY